MTIAQKGRLTRSSNDQEPLIHNLYGAALDNSLWPEILIQIVEHVNALEDLPAEARDIDAIRSVNAHLERAYEISERMIDLQETCRDQEQLLGVLNCGITLIDAEGTPYFQSQIGADDRPAELAVPTRAPSEQGVSLPAADLAARLKRTAKTGEIEVWIDPGTRGCAKMLLPQSEVARLGFPPRATAVLISVDLEASGAIDRFSQTYRLSAAETRLLSIFIVVADLRAASEEAGITYETARKYLKDIFQKTGTRSQAELMQRVLFSPAAVLSKQAPNATDIPEVRRILTLPDQRQLEYFALGPEAGAPLLFFDALGGSVIDLVGHPERYLPRLEELGLRIVTPCRPGGYRSSYRPLPSLSAFAPDIEALCDHLGFDKVSLLSYSYGSHMALAMAHALPDRVERVTMSSVSYMAYSVENWRDFDVFFQLTNVIGRRWPALLNRLIPFLARSIIHNVHRFADRKAREAKCEHDRAILNDIPIRERTRDMLQERIAQGFRGIIEEYRLNSQPYDFDVRDLQMPMTLLHGDCDVNNPLGGAELLAEHLPNADLHILRGMGHHHLFVEWDWIFAIAMGHRVDIPEPAALA